MPEQFYPYEFADGALALALEALAIDGGQVTLSEVFDADSRSVGLSGRSVQQDLSLQVSVTGSSALLAAVVPTGTEPEAALTVGARVVVQATRFRRLVICEADGNGRWVAKIDVAAASVADRMTITPVAVRRADCEPVAGLAYRKGEEVADGKALVVELERRPAVPGNALDTEWKDFGAADSPDKLRERKDLAWFLDLSDVDHPRLLLNQGIKDFQEILEVPGAIGRKARARDVLIQSMLQPAITLLAAEAARGMFGSDEPDDEGWQARLLGALASHADGMTADLTRDAWRAMWADQRFPEFALDIETAVQRHLRVGDGVRALISELGGEDSE